MFASESFGIAIREAIEDGLNMTISDTSMDSLIGENKMKSKIIVIFDGLAYIGGFTMCARWFGGLFVKRYSRWAYFKTVIQQTFHLGDNDELVSLLKKYRPVRVLSPKASSFKEGG